MLTPRTYFGPEFFEFLVELWANNNREWFRINNMRYESVVREPLLAFVSDFAVPLREISRYYVADPRPVGGSIFRVYRDTRFSRDKTPYKTHAAAHFRHEASRDAHAPGFYLHLEPGNVYGGAGIWQPDPESLRRVRDAIAANPVRWQGIVSDESLRTRGRFEGESLKRPPQGYDPNHPLIEDLKRKDFIYSTSFSEEDACAPGFIDLFSGACKAAAPYLEFLTTAIGLPW